MKSIKFGNNTYSSKEEHIKFFQESVKQAKELQRKEKKPEFIDLLEKLKNKYGYQK